MALYRIEDWNKLKEASGKGVLAGASSGNPTASSTPAQSPYNKDTDFANEQAYLSELAQNGNEGEKAWANNQMSVLKDAMAQYGPTQSTTPYTAPTYTATGSYNDAGLPDQYKQQIDVLQKAYAEAMARGDTAAAEQAHNIAESIRAQYGYSGGADGSEKIDIGNLDALSWNANYDTANPKPTYEDPTVDGNTYSAETEKILSEILNREDFAYNIEKDPLYAQYKTTYNREGDRAMRDTLAEAAASAGGMNSYAITAAQQANNYYASQLNDKIPELYQLAYEMYLQDKESDVENLGLISQLDDKQYGRYRDTMDDYWKDKNFAYGAYLDDYNQGSNEQSTAKDEVWKLISIGVTPSADLIAKAGMSNTDVNLAVAAVKAGSTGGNDSTGGNGYKGDSGNTGNTGGSDNTDFTGNTSSTSGVSDEIKKKCESFTNNTALSNYIDGLVAAGTISEEEGVQLYAQYVDDNEKYIANEDGSSSNTHSYGEMVKSTNGWEVVDNGGINWFGGVDNNAILKAPNGEQIRLDNLVDKLVSEGMSKKDAKDAIKALQKNLKIVG